VHFYGGNSNPDQKSSNYSNNPTFGSAESLVGLQGLQRDLASLNERIKTKETFINSNFDLQDFASTQNELKKVTAQHTALSESLMNLQIDHKSVCEEVDEVKSKMESLSSTVTDTAPIVRIKDAFQKLRTETRKIEVKIGVLSHTLMQAKSNSALSAKRANSPGSQSQLNNPLDFKADN